MALLMSFLTFNGGQLPPQVPFELELRLKARQVDVAGLGQQIEFQIASRQ